MATTRYAVTPKGRACYETTLAIEADCQAQRVTRTMYEVCARISTLISTVTEALPRLTMDQRRDMQEVLRAQHKAITALYELLDD